MSELAIRELEDLDLSDAIRLIVDSFNVDGHTPGQYNIQRVRERLVASFSPNDYAPRFLIAELGERIVGIAGYKLEIASDTWGLFLSSVQKEYRSQGIGGRLNLERLSRIEKSGMTGRIVVSTKHRKRFERCGFKAVDTDEALWFHPW